MNLRKLTFSSIAENRTMSLSLLALLASAFYIGLGHVHLFDWDEINFAESAREMIVSGDYLHVQINYSPFWEKPPFFIWLQMISMKIFGVNEFAARFPNALFGFIYLVTLYRIGSRHFSARFGLKWALLFFASLLPNIYFRSGIIDPVFNFFIFLSIYYMIRTLQGTEEDNFNRTAVLSGLFSGLSVITKGPVGFLILGLTLFIYLITKKFRTFPSFKSILLFLTGFCTIIIIWLSMEVYQNGFDILGQFIAYQIELFNSPVAGHAQPFYYHFVVVFFGCFPMSIIALPSLFNLNRPTPLDMNRWMVILFWSVLILFSIVTTKIIHYSSMTYLPLSYLAAFSLTEERLKKVYRYLYLAIGILIGSALFAIPAVIINKEKLYAVMNDPFAVASLKAAPAWNGSEYLAGIFFVVMTIAGFFFLIRKRQYIFLAITSLNTLITFLILTFQILPKIESITQRPMIEMCQELGNKNAYISVYGFKSYAHLFYTPVKMEEDDRHKDQDWLLNGDVDKDVYFISKITNTELDQHPNFNKVRTSGGFCLYERISDRSGK